LGQVEGGRHAAGAPQCTALKNLYNASMRARLTCLFALLLFSACTPAGGQAPGAGTPRAYLTPTRTPTRTVIPALTEIVLPTPTPTIHVVVLGDTLGDIADRYGVTLEALLAANPGVQPTALTVGMELVIPIGSSLPAEPTPTPAPVMVRQAQCWDETGGGLWCFALLENGLSEALENIAAQFSLLDEDGQVIAEQIAYAPLNLLPPGGAMPLGVHFAAPAPAPAGVRLQVLTAIRLLPGDVRYLPVMLENTLVQLGTGGQSARVSGRVMLTVLDGSAAVLWVLAVAYDRAGNLVGFRRWEAGAPLAGGESLDFDFLVSSVGPAIERVDFLVEARP